MVLQHLLCLLRSELDANVELKSPLGQVYHLHRVVLAARAPNLLLRDKVKIPESPLACKQLFEWIYTRECDNLNELTALDVVQMLQTVQGCAPCLGQLQSRLEQRFVHLITLDKEENLMVAENSAFMENAGSNLVTWVKNSLADHLARQVCDEAQQSFVLCLNLFSFLFFQELNERDLARLPRSLMVQVSIDSHQPARPRPLIVFREESSLESCFAPMIQAAESNGRDADFEIRFQDGSSPLFVHGCMISRCAFFEAFLRNLNPAQGRVFVSKTPRSAMLALLTYLYGGDLSFSPWDAIFLMSPENGVAFYFAASSEHSQEMDTIFSAMHLALTSMPVEQSVEALLQARALGIPTAEAALVDLMADRFGEVEGLLDSEKLGKDFVIEVQRAIIYSLLTKNEIANGENDTTLNESML